MSRWVVSAQKTFYYHGATAPQDDAISRIARDAPPDNATAPQDDAIARIAKYVPSEVLGIFTLLFTILASLQVSDIERQYASVGLIFVFFIATVVYITQRAPEGKVRRAHLIVSPLAFIAWSYPISGAALDTWFLPLVAFSGQAIVMALSIFIKPASE